MESARLTTTTTILIGVAVLAALALAPRLGIVAGLAVGVVAARRGERRLALAVLIPVAAVVVFIMSALPV